MTTATRTGPRDAPPRPWWVEAVVFDDGDYLLCRSPAGWQGTHYLFRRTWHGDFGECGYIWYHDGYQRSWEAIRTDYLRGNERLYVGNDAERALAALWAARGT